MAVLTAAVALTTSACLGSSSNNTNNSGSGGNATGGTAAGSTVEIMYAYGGDQDKGFRASLDPWAKSQGITIKYNSSDQFDKLIQTRVQGGDLPNIAVFPQPGIIKGFGNRPGHPNGAGQPQVLGDHALGNLERPGNGLKAQTGAVPVSQYVSDLAHG